MFNVSFIKFKRFSDPEGNLIPIEGASDVPFDIKRVYYINGVPSDVIRGFHAHKHLHQILICVQGKVSIRVKNHMEEKDVLLDHSDIGLYIGPMVWREMHDFSQDGVLLVLASDHYNENDYIRNYSQFEKLSRDFYD